MESFDTVVLGAGPAGEVIAGRLAEGGQKVAIVERELVGGECSFWACMPSKALLRPAEILAEVRRVPGAAEAATGSLDVHAVLDRRDEVIHDLDDSGMEPWLDGLGIALYRSTGALDGPKRVKLDSGEVLEARNAVVIATGSRASFPPIPGLAESDPWANREITTAKEVPRGLVIIGGGVVGCEMAQAWNSLGTHVTLVEGARHLLPKEEVFACELVSDALTEAGVDIRTSRKAKAVRKDGDNVVVVLDDDSEVECDRVVAALGRTPNTDEIGLETVGLEGGGTIEVDDRLRVPGHDWLYAIGDVIGHGLLTHMGKYQARIAADNILGKPAALSPLADGPPPPRVVFTDPQVAAVGHTTATAEKAGLNVRAVDVSTSGNAGGSFYGRDAPGRTLILVDEDRKVIVGATFVGAEVADFVHAATIAVVGEVPLEKLWHAVPSFPTRSELWLKLLEKYGL
ncbi:MAG: NAD(P)/FAD-dependent oxidoreductase [Solirubrobacterales bacterium]|nr:NAD(P)/FAD-dependent oxidoreductase [Solirubrobacterales bacterium]